MKGLNKPVSRIFFGTATPAMLAGKCESAGSGSCQPEGDPFRAAEKPDDARSQLYRYLSASPGRSENAGIRNA